MCNSEYIAQDTKRIQTRISNQSANLLTAVLHEGVPLTNNAAELAVRPSVIIRKISGSSQSWKGTDTHVINISVFQSICKRNMPIYDSLFSLLYGASVKL